MKLRTLHIESRFKNINGLKIDFTNKDGLTVIIGNNGTGKSNLLEAISSIFAGLYNQSLNPIFNYSIAYDIDDNRVEIKFDVKSQHYSCKVNSIEDNIKPEYTPNQVISCYSGEETRLWDTYFSPFYKAYIDAIRGMSIPNQPLVFINKYYWEIALLTFHFYDFDVFSDIKEFCQKQLKVHTVNYIEFSFDVKKIDSWEANPIVDFVNKINPSKDSVVKLSLEELKNRLSHITNEKDFFNYLSAASMPKGDKLITKINFNFNENITTNELSEGEKKLILVKLILEVIGDEKTLILLDEPDSHIHVSKKRYLHTLLQEYSSRENILTTHSPTLTSNFENKHIVMLKKDENDDSSIVDTEKQDLVSQLTDGVWSHMEQNIFLNTDSHILLVEGKFDINIIKEAIVKLDNEKNAPLTGISYIPTGGASGLRLFIDKFKPKNNQCIIGILDSDLAGNNEVKEVLTNEEQKDLEKNYFVKINKLKNTFLLKLPKLQRINNSQYEIEDYFPIKNLINISKNQIDTFKVLKDFTLKKDSVKRKLNEQLESYPKVDFDDFQILLDLILTILEKNEQEQ
ncbi:ATP-dependent nuclease [Colwellia sp. E150_009]